MRARTHGARVFLAVVSLATSAWLAHLAEAQKPERTVRGRMQAKPGGPVEEVEVGVHRVPVNPPSVTAEEASLPETDLVLGVLVEGKPMAYPIRYLATTEILDDQVGDTPLAPSW